MFHGVGSGKTLTAVVCAYWYLQLYPSNRVICISPSALLYNFIEGMRQYGVDIQDNRYFFTTYDKYVRMSREAKNATDCLLIVDEAHNLRTEMKIDYVTDPNDPDKVLYREARVNKRGFNILEYGAKNAHKTLLLTGTAFVNTIYDIENLIAMVDKREPLLKTTFSYMVSSTSNISDYFSYKISYVPSSKSDFFPERREKLIPLYMTEKMQQEYNSFKNAKRNYFYIREKLKMNVVENEDTEMNPKIKWCIDEIHLCATVQLVVRVSPELARTIPVPEIELYHDLVTLFGCFGCFCGGAVCCGRGCATGCEHTSYASCTETGCSKAQKPAT